MIDVPEIEIGHDRLDVHWHQARAWLTAVVFSDLLRVCHDDVSAADAEAALAFWCEDWGCLLSE